MTKCKSCGNDSHCGVVLKEEYCCGEAMTMICRKCEKVAEIDEKKSGLKLDKKSLSEFKIEESIIEIIGICKKCISLEAI